MHDMSGLVLSFDPVILSSRIDAMTCTLMQRPTATVPALTTKDSQFASSYKLLALPSDEHLQKASTHLPLDTTLCGIAMPVVC